MSVAKLGHKKLGGSCEGIFNFSNNFLSVLAFIFNSIGHTTDIAIIDENARRGVYHTKGWALSLAFLSHHVGYNFGCSFWCIVFGVNANQVASLSDIPRSLIPGVFPHVTRVLLEEAVDRVVVPNGS